MRSRGDRPKFGPADRRLALPIPKYKRLAAALLQKAPHPVSRISRELSHLSAAPERKPHPPTQGMDVEGGGGGGSRAAKRRGRRRIPSDDRGFTSAVRPCDEGRGIAAGNRPQRNRRTAPDTYREPSSDDEVGISR